jgi:hypothetical protein
MKPLKASADPRQYLLKSFNVFKIEDIREILQELKDCTRSDIPSGDIKVTKENHEFKGTVVAPGTTQSFEEKMCEQMGVKGKYAVYLASILADKTIYTNSVNAGYYAAIRCGYATCSKTGEKLTQLLDESLVDELNAISDFQSAEDFTNNWGTHLVKRVHFGGSMYIKAHVNTPSVEENAEIETKINDAFASVLGIGRLAEAMMKVGAIQSKTKLKQSLSILGGKNKETVDPANAKSFTDWAASCSDEDAYSISETVEMYMLARGDARKILEKYINLRLLQQSLRHPRIFIERKKMVAFNINEVTVSAPKDFKIIGGGAAVTRGSNNYLLGSYPLTDSTRERVNGWRVTSHDCVDPTAPNDMMAAYAIAIYDPGNYIGIKIEIEDGRNPGPGPDQAFAMIGSPTQQSDWLGCGGGGYSLTRAGSNKFIRQLSIGFSRSATSLTWGHEHDVPVLPNTHVEMRAFVVGIKSKEPQLTIEMRSEQGPPSTSTLGEATCLLPETLCGGDALTGTVHTNTNLMQACYPVNANTWAAANRYLPGGRGASTICKGAYILVNLQV